MKWAAERLDVELMKNEQAKAILEAYTAGVNAYINSLDPESYPIEYKILNYQPEAWTTVKVAYLLKYMSEMLTGGTDDMRYTNALQS
jgi:penicillin amidase